MYSVKNPKRNFTNKTTFLFYKFHTQACKNYCEQRVCFWLTSLESLSFIIESVIRKQE